MNDQGRTRGGARQLIAVAMVLGGIGLGAQVVVHRPAPAVVARSHSGDVRPVAGDRWYADPPFAQGDGAPHGDRWYEDPTL